MLIPPATFKNKNTKHQHPSLTTITWQLRLKLAFLCFRLDKLVEGGLTTGEVVEVCGGSGEGKTTLCLQVALHAALEQGIGVLYVDPVGSLNHLRVNPLVEALPHDTEVCFPSFLSALPWPVSLVLRLQLRTETRTSDISITHMQSYSEFRLCWEWFSPSSLSIIALVCSHKQIISIFKHIDTWATDSLIT